MIDQLFQMTISNVCISLALAIIASIAGVTLKRPALTHLLWLLVFVKLLTPPVVTFPVIPIQWRADTAAGANFEPAQPADAVAVQASGSETNAYLSTQTWAVVFNHGKVLLLTAWLMGSVFVVAWSSLYAFRFGRLLREEAEAGTPELQAAAAEIAAGLRLRTVPAVYTTSAQISPMVWWMGGRVWVVVPAALLEQMDAWQLRGILAHELAHVRRRDYLVRWIEWLACIGFWWNPVAWWARHNLRANEELCCDALVISCLNLKPHTYGESLLKAVEILACPAHRPPALASNINSGGLIERRITMIMSTNPNRSSLRWLQACVLAGALVVIPLGLTYSQDGTQDRNAVIARIQTAVAAGEITAEQGKAKLAAYDRKVEFETIAAKIQAAVQAGKLTEEQGRAKLDDSKKVLAEKARLAEEQAVIAEQIRAAIAAGQITPDQGKAKLAAANQRPESVDAVKQQLWAAIQAGKITEEQAKAKLDAYQKSQVQLQPDFAAVVEEIRTAVAAGTITHEEGKAKLDAYKKSLDRKPQGGNPIAAYKADVFKLRAAVADGSMTEEQAAAMMTEIAKVQIERAVSDLSAAVEAGKLSKEEAAAKMTAFLNALEAIRSKR